MGIVFRSAHPADAGGLVALVAELGYPAAVAELGERLSRLLSDSAHAVVVAEEAGRILGVIQVQESHSLTTPAAGLVSGLVVSEGARGRGLGRGLMEAAEAWVRGRGLKALRLRSRVTRAGAHDFYRRLGYVTVKEQVMFERVLP